MRRPAVLTSKPSGIVILGAERSGTSMLAEMVHRWGAHPGDPAKLTPPSEHSPRGQWEYEPLWDLLAELGDFASGQTWWDPLFPQRMADRLQDPAMVARANALLAELRVGDVPWLLKDPALCHFLPFWQPLWGTVAYLVAVRHPVDIARSWARMVAPARLHGSDLTRCNLLRWQYMTRNVLRATEGTGHRIFLAYEHINRDPQTGARRLCEWLDARFARVPDEARIAKMVEVVESSHWRNRTEAPLEDFAEATPEQCRLYSRLLRSATGHEATFEDDDAMPQRWEAAIVAAEKRIRDATL